MSCISAFCQLLQRILYREGMLKEVSISLRSRETRFVFHVPISNSFKSDAKASALGTRCERSVHSEENLTSPLMYFRISSGAFAWKRGPSMNIFCLYLHPHVCLSTRSSTKVCPSFWIV